MAFAGEVEEGYLFGHDDVLLELWRFCGTKVSSEVEVKVEVSSRRMRMRMVGLLPGRVGDREDFSLIGAFLRRSDWLFLPGRVPRSSFTRDRNGFGLTMQENVK